MAFPSSPAQALYLSQSLKEIAHACLFALPFLIPASRPVSAESSAPRILILTVFPLTQLLVFLIASVFAEVGFEPMRPPHDQGPESFAAAHGSE
jgi:formate hydrogenlyase subunit 4